MNIQDTETPLHGVHRGLYAGQFDRVDELNSRVSDRHFPDRGLQPNFSPRPVPTKYSLFPVIERRAPVSVPITEMPKHKLADNFSPATRLGPVSTYLANIDTETILRNQTTALQHGAEQGVYVPSSQSSLYNVSVAGRVETQTHPGLFEERQYATMPSALDQYGVGVNHLYNHTRTQLRNIVDSIQSTYETPNVVSSRIAQSTYETPNVVSSGIAQSQRPPQTAIGGPSQQYHSAKPRDFVENGLV
jgi:hypothetical protein